MEFGPLHTLIFALPVYQLIYFFIQIVIARHYTDHRLFAGIFMFTVVWLSIGNVLSVILPQNATSFQLLFFLFLTIGTPALYLFLVRMTSPDFSPGRHIIIRHFTGSVFLIISGLTYLLATTVLFPKQHYSITANEVYYVLGVQIKPSQFLAFLIIVYVIYELGRFVALGRNIFAKRLRKNGENTNLKINYISGILILGLLSLFQYSDFRHWPVAAMAYNFLLFLLGGATGYTSNKLLEPISRPDINHSPPVQPENNNLKTAVPHLNTEDSQKIATQIDQVMMQNKSYLNPKFSLDELCQLLQKKKWVVGYVISHTMQTNFYGLVNAYRIEESIRILNSEESRKYTIDTIALMSGFQSKSSFYAAFKKIKNTTPGEYKASPLSDL